ncbi:MAG TPA: CHAT domain-containing protein, partial [Polyangium sp.]|nr:CHAT domain-containing protein [Polyangium sp.]
MSTSDTQPTWIEFTITSDETRVFVAIRGSRWEQLSRRDLGISRDKLEKFAGDVERAAAYGQPVGGTLLADAQAIHKALLDGESGVRFGRLCEAGGGSLLVRFVVEDPVLRAVPWEALCSADESLWFWGTSASVFPVRGAFSGEPWLPREVSGAIRVLAIAPNGSDGLTNLKLALAERIERKEVEWLEPLEGPITRVPAILDRLRQGPASHVVHFLGHGRLAAPNRPELRMADDSDGEEKWIAAGLFAEQLKAHFRDNLRLIVLEACEGAKPGAFASAAEILAGAGADAVVAHLWPVRADAAQTFSTQFYRALTEAHHGAGDVLFAANEGRRAVLGANEGSAQALSAVVVLRGPDGKVFHFERRDQEVRPSTTLPPIVERLPQGEEGRQEFADLIGGLIRIYSGIWKFQRHHGPVWHPYGSYIHRIGISFPGLHDEIFIVWPTNDIRQGEVADDLKERITELVPYDDYEFEESGKKTYPFIFPRYLTRDERAWLEAQSKSEVVVVEARDMAYVAELLNRCPAILARYYPELAAKELPGLDPGFDFRTFNRYYCEEIIRDKERVDLLGFPPEALRGQDAKAHIRLADLFVPTVFCEQQNRDNRMALASLLSEEKSVIVLGDPGMGKTMLLSYLALLHARGAATWPEYTPPPRRIPLFVSLREYALAEQEARKDYKQDLSLLDYLAQHYKRKRNLASAHPAFFDAALRMEEAIVLLDGLDEVGSRAARRQVAERVRDMRREYPNCPIWVTSRIHGYTHDIALSNEDFDHIMIGALDDAQIDDFLSRWYSIQFPYDSSKQTEQKSSLRQAIFRTKQVRALAENPLLLSLMAFVHRVSGDLPQDRGELYDKCVEMLLRNWLEARERRQKHAFEELALPKELPRDYLEALAYHVQERGLLINDEANHARGLFSRDDALAFLTTHHADIERRSRAISSSKAQNEMRDFIDYACDRVGLLADRGGGKLSFLHLSFQEYLAATHETLLTTLAAQQEIFARHSRDATWAEVLLLRLYLFSQKRGASGRDILDKLVSGMLEDLERS